MIILREVESQVLEPWRIDRLSALPLFQELYLEFLATGKLGPVQTCLVYRDEEILGHVIVGEGESLYEFHHHPGRSSAQLDCFNGTLEALRIRTILCQSFDESLLRLCRHRGFQSRVLGLLYREEMGGSEFLLEDLKPRWATAEDLPLLNSLDDEVFEPRALLKQEIDNQGVMLFFLEKKLAGCGFLTRIHPAFNYADLGVWTSLDFRRRGVARRIVSHLRKTGREKGFHIICGCDAANTASQQTLACNGFISRHSLLEFTVD